MNGTFCYSPVQVLFPSPATDTAATLTLTLPGTMVQVLDALGRSVASVTADTNGAVALVLPAGMPTGVYVMRGGTRAMRLTVE